MAMGKFVLKLLNQVGGGTSNETNHIVTKTKTSINNHKKNRTDVNFGGNTYNFNGSISCSGDLNINSNNTITIINN